MKQKVGSSISMALFNNILRFAKLTLGLMLVLAAFVQPSLAQRDAREKVSVFASEEEGFVRLKLTFAEPTDYKLEFNQGVVTLLFQEPFEFNFNDLKDNSFGLIIAHRVDPDFLGFRLGLSSNTKVSDVTAAEYLFIDLLPVSWSQAAPSIPADIVRELAERAEQAEQTIRDKSRETLSREALTPLDLQYGERPTFTRLVISGSEALNPAVSRAGDKFKLTFNFLADLDIRPLRRYLPRYLRDVETELGSSELDLTLTIDPALEVRSLSEGKRFIVDIFGPPEEINRDDPVVDDTEASISDAIKRITGSRGKGLGKTVFPGAAGKEKMVQPVVADLEPDGPAKVQVTMPEIASLEQRGLDIGNYDEAVPELAAEQLANIESAIPEVVTADRGVLARENTAAVNSSAANTIIAPNRDENIRRGENAASALESKMSPEPEMMAEDKMMAEPEMMAEDKMMAEPEMMAEDKMMAEPEMMAEDKMMAEPEMMAEDKMMAEPEMMAEDKMMAEPEMMAEDKMMAEPKMMAEDKMMAEPEMMAEDKMMAEPEMMAEDKMMAEPEMMAEAKGTAAPAVIPVQGGDIPKQALQPGDLSLYENGSDYFRLGFSVSDQVPAAAFVRGRRILVVFDQSSAIDVGSFGALQPQALQSIESYNFDQYQLVVINLEQSNLTSFFAKDGEWNLEVGRIQSGLAKVRTLQKIKGEEGETKAFVPITNGATIHKFDDPLIGDPLTVVTASLPVQSVVKGAKNVDFELLPSLHGLAIRINHDETNLSLNDQLVLIDRQGGLAISAGQDAESEDDNQTKISDEDRQLDFRTWFQPGNFIETLASLERKVAAAAPNTKTNESMNLAKFLVARNLPEEALGVLRNTADQDILADRRNDYERIKGIAHLLKGDNSDAAKSFDKSPTISRDPEMAIWRALLDKRQGNKEDALSGFMSESGAIESYPPSLQIPLRFEAHDLAFDLGQLGYAAEELKSLNRLPLNLREMQNYRLRKARMADATGDIENAERIYLESIRTGYPPVESEARLDYVDFLMRQGKMDLEAAVSELRNLAVSWRGNETELEALSRVSDFYIDSNQYREAFESTREMSSVYPDNPVVNQILEKMKTVFTELYLSDRGDKIDAIERLALFYDFAELTPIGSDGDLIIRALAEEMIDLSLLDQASTLLDYQVENRLSGAAKAQVAADSALVYLMNRKPADAIKILRKSRQSQLPRSVEERRVFLEAQALIDLSRPDSALALVRDMEGETPQLIRIDAFVRAQNWQEAAETTERVLGKRWQGASELGEVDRQHVLRAAVGYALAEDNLGLARLAQKFSAKMENGPSAAAFALLTDTSKARGLKFVDIVEEIATTTNFERFLEETRQSGLPPFTVEEQAETASPAQAG